MSNEYLKDEFSEWINSSERNRGLSYSENTKKNYIFALENECNQIKNLNIKKKDLFNITCLEEFKIIDKLIRKNKDFERLYEEDYFALSEAMIEYKQFLKERDRIYKVAWFVEAFIDGKDQTERFINEGIWENGYEDKYIDDVEDIEVGDRIAIKKVCIRKQDLPFDNYGKNVVTMEIKAIGIVTHNFNDGHKIAVEWEKFDIPKEWYVFVNTSAIWKVYENTVWEHNNLIDFTFNKKKQYINSFTWWSYANENPFTWPIFYKKIATELLKYKNNRNELIEEINNIFKKVNINDKFLKYIKKENIKDICPFTIFALFNNNDMSDEKRILILKEIASFLQVKETILSVFKGIPILNNIKSCFFRDKGDRKKEDIDNLWELFEIAIKFSENYTEENKQKFIKIYNKIIEKNNIDWNISIGLYWIRPYDYIPLYKNIIGFLIEEFKDSYILYYLNNNTNITYKGKEYIDIIGLIKNKIDKTRMYPFNCFPELSYNFECENLEAEYNSYTKEDFLNEVFVSDEYYETIRYLLKRKKNIILQGAPGVGKTYAAKRLAWAMMGQVDTSRIEMVQFHQSYSYEDFIEGYMPTEKGFELKRGSFYKFCKLACENKEKDYYFIIDEINRGNMSKIFGELMMLIESDKRGEELILTYSNEKFSVPENLYIIGMMNTADRSLAIIDYALRRRFCFIDLEPAFDTNKFKEHLLSLGASEELVNKIKSKMMTINSHITKDVNLGKDFRIGHSYFCNYKNYDGWYKDIIKYEIAPLIREYWFDDEDKANNHIEELLRG